MCNWCWLCSFGVCWVLKRSQRGIKLCNEKQIKILWLTTIYKHFFFILCQIESLIFELRTLIFRNNAVFYLFSWLNFIILILIVFTLILFWFFCQGHVTILVRSVPLRSFDKDVVEKILRVMRESITVVTGVTPVKIEKTSSGTLRVTYSNGEENEFDTVLAAVGKVCHFIM